MFLFLKVITTDPGILARKMVENDTNPLVPLPERYAKVIVHGKEVKLTYCYTCHFYRPRRSHHCATCDHCVDVWDHHCPYTACCIGSGNYRWFYGFLLMSWIGSLGTIGFSLYQFILLVQSLSTKYHWIGFSAAFGWAVLYSLGSILLSLFILPFSLAAGSLFAVHTFLICIDQTTYERLKKQPIEWKIFHKICPVRIK